jgi:small-conductance mechanosensitive channel
VIVPLSLFPGDVLGALSLFPGDPPVALGGRLAISIVVALVTAILVWIAARSKPWTEDLSTSAVIDLVRSTVVVAALVVAGWLLVETWGLETDLARAFSQVAPANWLPRAALTGVVVVGTWVAVGIVRRLLTEAVEGYGAVDRHRQEIIYRVTQVTLLVLSGLVVLAVWRVNLGGLLVGAGVAGIVLGLAARQTLGAVIAGFVLMFSRPFEIGDWVAIAGQEGFVTGITIFNTRLQTVDAEGVVVPNDEVTSESVVNYTSRNRLRVRVPVSVAYDTDLERARTVAVEAMETLDDVLDAPAPSAVLTDFGDSGIGLELRFWIDRPSPRKRWRAQTAVVGAVKSAYDEAGITIPFPQRTIGSRGQIALDAPTAAAGDESRPPGSRAGSAGEGSSDTADSRGDPPADDTGGVDDTDGDPTDA